jgi:glycosyltransferase involved in cell wall biosynthesis
LLSDEALRNECGAQAAQLAVREFSWDRALDALEAMYRGVVEGAVRKAPKP